MGLFRRHCDVHDRAAPLKIAQLEQETGVNPNAVAELRSDPDSCGGFVAAFADPDLIDCGNRWCRARREGQ